MKTQPLSNFALELVVGLALGLLAAVWLAVSAPTTLDQSAYALASHILSGHPATPSEMALRLAWSLAAPLGGGGPAEMVGFLLALPPIALALCALLSYLALRLWGFDALESGVAALLALLCAPLLLAFYPGLLPAPMLALPLMALGSAGLAGSAGGSKPYAIPAALLALGAFGAAVWIYPWAVALPLGLLVATLAENHRDEKRLVRGGTENLVRLAALALPVLAFLALSPPAFVLSGEGVLRFLHDGRFAVGLGAVALPAVLAGGRHPKALFFSALGVVALALGPTAPAAALMTLMAPIAYGLRTLGQSAEEPLETKAAMMAVALLLITAGLFAGGADFASAAGEALLVMIGALALLHLYHWPAPLMRHGLALFLVACSVLVAAQMTPTSMTAPPYPYRPLDPATQEALLWLGANAQAPSVVAWAPPEAIALLSGGTKAADDISLARFLAGHGPGEGLPKAGQYILAEPSALARLKGEEDVLGRPWTLVPFIYYSTTVNAQTGQPVAQFVSQNGYVLVNTVDTQGLLVPDRPALYSLATGRTAGNLVLGDVVALRPEEPVNATGNLVVWYGKEYDSNALQLLVSTPPGYEEVRRLGGSRILKVIG